MKSYYMLATEMKIFYEILSVILKGFINQKLLLTQTPIGLACWSRKTES